MGKIKSSQKDCLVTSVFYPMIEKEAGVLGDIGKSIGNFFGGSRGTPMKSQALVDSAYQQINNATDVNQTNAAFKALEQAHAAIIQEIQVSQKQDRDRHYQRRMELLKQQGQGQQGQPAGQTPQGQAPQ